MQLEDRDAEIAVVGMSCRLPGARDTAEFWENLCAGVESISFFSDEELLREGVPAGALRDPSFVRAHGSIPDAFAFDAPFFGVNPSEALVMDPQQRVFLECAWSALEDAGYDPGRFPGAVGVYAGSGTNSYLWRVLSNREVVSAVGEELARFANGKDFLTSRVSYKLGLRGPSVVVQTACSTSLVAIHLACQSLLNRECDLALSGGVTVSPEQVAGYRYQEGGIRSPDGHCRAFDARAAGTVAGSGAGVVVLKRMVDALRDGDAIRAVIKGSAINNDGAEKVGFTAPSVKGQAKAIAEALAVADVDPSTVSYVEAHGTGTPLGDPIEIEALAEVFRSATGRRGFCALGAVKSNIGHVDSAAGVAGFIKTVLALEHRVLPPTLHFEKPNPDTGLEDSPFYVSAALQEWRGDGGPRRAGVSSFGMGGTNAHVVLEEAPELPQPPAGGAAQLLVLSARSGDALERMRRNLAEHLGEHAELALADVAYTLQEGRAAHPHRWAAVARDLAEAREALAGEAARLPATRPAPDRPPRVALLFPGQGTQYAGMARDLYEREPVFRREIDRCAAALLPGLGMDLRSALFPPEGGEDRANALLEQTRYTQPALFTTEYALAKLWMSWGVQPEAMLGHSIGEYVAACIAGVFSLDDALRIVEARGRLMQDLPPGAMLAVPLSEAEVRALLPERVSLAAVNSPAHCVVSGSAPDVDGVEALLAGRGVSARRLHTSHAFHSAAMDPVLEAFAAVVGAARPSAPGIPFLSNLTGDWITPEQATDPGYWVRHLRETIRFADGAGRLLEEPGRVLLEVGPGDTLGTFARRHGLADAGRTVVRSLPRAGAQDGGGLAVLEAAGSLWTAGVGVDWRAVRGDERRRRVPLPTYPFERTVYRVPSPHLSPATAASSPAAAPDRAPASPPAHSDPQHTAEPMRHLAGTRDVQAPGRRTRIAAALTAIFEKVVGKDLSGVDATRTFVELGADSLLLMQASRNIESTFGVKVPFRRLLEGCSTIGELSAHLDGEMPAEAELPPEASRSAPAPAAASPAEAAPLPAPAAPARDGAPPGGGSAMHEIVAQQLATLQTHAAIMQQQLELLRGGALSPAAAPDGSRPEAEGVRPAPPEPREAAAPAEQPASHGPHRPVSQTIGQGGGFTERQARYFDEFVRRYNARTRRSKEYAAENRSHLADNRASLNFRMASKELLYPVVGERSQGSRLWDLDGNEYVDFTIGFGVHFFGHRPAFVVEAVEEQLRRGFHLGPQSDLAGPVARLFRELTGAERVTFCNTGSEAVMTALRIARTVTGRDRVVLFDGSYHGCFDGILARPVGGSAGSPRSCPVAPGTTQGMVEDVVVLPYGTPETLAYLEANAAGIAAVLVEPVQSRNPEFHPVEFLRELRELTSRAGTALVFDEMITGFRLQATGAQGFYGVEADLATYGKVIGGGFPLGVVAGRASFMDAIDGGAWGFGDDSYPAANQTFFAGTFCKHPVTMAAAHAVLMHIRERGPALYEELNGRAARLVAALREVFAEEEAPIRILHCGSLFQFRFDPQFRFGDLLFQHVLERGIYVWEGRACFLSTAHTDADCDLLVLAVRESIRAVRDGGFLPGKSGPGGGSHAAAAPAEPEAPSAQLPRSFPLTHAQRQIWVHCQLGDDASRAYNEQIVVGLRGRLDVPALREAVADLMAHHESLRTVFDASGEVQHVLPTLPVPLFLPGRAADAGSGELAASLEEAVRSVFDLEAGPPFRVHVHAGGPEFHVVQLIIHHLVADGFSAPLVKRDLSAAYLARRDGRAPDLPEAMQFSEYARLLAAHAAEHADREAEWLARFRGAVPLALPTDRPRPRFPTSRAASHMLTLRPPLVSGLKELSRRQGHTLFTTLLAGVLATLHRIAGQDDMVVGIPSACRPFPGSGSLVGDCADMLPVRSRIPRPTSILAFLGEVRGWLLDAIDHEVFAYTRLQEKLQLPRGPGRPPLVSVSFNLEPLGKAVEEGGAPELADLDVQRVGSATHFTKLDLVMDTLDLGDEIRVVCLFNTDLFDRGTVERMLEQLERVLEQVASRPETGLSELDLLGEDERRRVVEEWNRTEADFPADRCLHELFEEQARRAPGAAAVVFGDCSLTYAELDGRAGRLARQLRRRGVGPEVRVAICLERTPEVVAAILGVLKAGGAYVPLDPAYPAERLERMVADSGAAVVLTQEKLRALLPVPPGVELVSVDGERTRAEDGPEPPSGCGPEARNLAYVIYTSGSTGVPKGIALAHRGVVNNLLDLNRGFGVGPEDRVLLLSSLSFDMSVYETLGILAAGGAVVVPTGAELRDPARWAELMRRHGVSVWNSAPALLGMLVDHLDEHPEDAPPALRLAFLGGDWVPVPLPDRLRAHVPGMEVVVMGGATEASIHSIIYPVRETSPHWKSIPYGVPMANQRAYVLDEELRPVPVGVSGELYLGGIGLARGYTGRADLTAERFLPDAQGPEAGARMYRTGDGARWQADGNLELIGRLDHQVKIRGFRIEPGEIEAVLRRHPGVERCVVAARDDASGDRRLVAYVVGGADADSLREHLKRSLPEYMVPGAFVWLESLPLSPNGKVDRKALPAPHESAADERYVAPRTPVEEVLAGIWAEVLRLERVGVRDSFFELGGHSLLATRIVSRVRAVFGVELPVRALFEASTVAELAERVVEVRQADLPQLPPVVPVERTGPLPLSFAQERLWFLHRLQPESGLYNVPLAVRLEGALDARALERALGEIVRRHEALRTVFHEREDAPVQVVAPFAGFTLPVEDLSGLDPAEVRRRVTAEAARPFDLAAGPLFRAKLLRQGDQEHVLLVCMHHIVSDGWSLGVFFRELSVLYPAYREGGESPLPELAVQYADFAAWQREQLRGEALDRQVSYWKGQLAGAPALLELPTDRARPAMQAYLGAHEWIELPAELVERLRSLGRSEGATLYMTVLAAFQALLSRYGGSEDVVVGSPIAGRTRREVEELIGLFVNTLVLRTDLAGNPSFREALRRVRQVTLAAYENQDVPFEKLVAELHPQRSLSHSPLFQVMFRLQAEEPSGGEIPGLQVRGADLDSETVKFDLNLSLAEHPRGLRGVLGYRTDLFERSTVVRMLHHLERVLVQVAESPDARLSGVDLLGEAERRRVVEEWNRTEAEYPAERCIHELVEAQARRTPDAVALVHGPDALTYAELEERADRLAHHLRLRGVGPEVRVGICLERGAEMVVCVLGVLKAGGAYVPLDPASPAERVGLMLADSGVAVLLTQDRLLGLLPVPAGVQVVSVDGMRAEDGAGSAAPVPAGVGPRNLAYVIYTSGSTGTPKGVGVEHRGVCNLVPALVRLTGLEPGARVLLLAPLHFDASAAEIFAALSAGAALYVADGEDLLPGEELIGLLRRERITHTKFTPSALAAVPPADLPELTTLVVGGEACSAELVDRWAPGRRFVNVYGPTEATVRVSAAVCRARSGPPSLGTALPNTRLYVLDGEARPVPVGVSGELYVAGVQLARGYLGRPGLTAERFVPDSFGEQAGGRLYRTGDRVRRREDGTLDFLGRTDFQLKVRGFRIEPGEVEARLLEHPGVRETVVLARDDGPGDRHLVAYYVGGEAVGAEALRTHLSERLPEYMVPAAFVRLGRLPLTPSGKLDRGALPAPEGDAYSTRAFEAPLGGAEAVVAEIWSDVLGVEAVGRWDHFFDLGGHSLLAVQVVSRVRQVLGVEAALGELFLRPVLADFARGLGQASRAELPAIERADRSRPLVLSFAQQRLWFLDRMGSAGAAYHIHMGLRLRGQLDREALVSALERIVARHEVLRTTFALVDGEPVQRIEPVEESGFHLLEHDLGGHADVEVELYRLMGEEAEAPFDLEQGPLVRGRLIRLSPDEHVLLATMHHIVSDGWSTGVLVREVSALYGAFARGEADPLPGLEVQYADYAVWQRRWVEGEVLRRQADYWRETLSGAPELLELSTDRPRPAEPDYAGAAFGLALDAELTAGLKALGRRHGSTLFMTLLAGWAVVLSRLSGQEDVVVGTPTANRGHREIEGLIGFFVNTLALRLELSGGPTVVELLGRVKARVLGGQQNQDIPFEQVVELVQPARSLAHHPLFQVVFAWQSAPRGNLELPGLTLGPVGGTPHVRAKYDLLLTLHESAGRIVGGVTYATALFDHSTVERYVGYLRNVLSGMVADECGRADGLALLPRGERRRVVEEWTRAEMPRAAEACIHELFAAQAARRPDAVAVVGGDAQLTYAELDARANRLARYLAGRGVGPESRVGLLLERTPEMVVAIMAVLKAGGCYVPLDPTHPRERHAFMLADAAISLVLTAEGAHDELDGVAVEVVSLDRERETIEREAAEAPAVAVTPEHLANIIYTSGSTGTPKGTAVPHRAIPGFFRDVEYARFDSETVFLQYSSISWDALTLELWSAVLSGGTCVLYPGRTPEPGELGRQLRAHGVNTLWLSAAFFNLLVDSFPETLEGVSQLLVGGEAVSLSHVRRAHELYPLARVVNGYGPSECTVFTTCYVVPREPEGSTVPIGSPVGDRRVYILDRWLDPAPPGVPGELYVGGPALARGYLNRPGLTAEKFVPDPFSGDPGARLYRTGDRVRWPGGGEIEYVGRLDEQVKVRGFRIEPGEIEAVLRRHPGVAECAVLARQDEPGEKRLVAYVVGRADMDEMRDRLRQELPEYMIPGAFVFLEQLPLTAHGKLDRSALPAPEYGTDEDRYVAPGTPVEEVLAGIWEEVLGVERVGTGDDFFRLGGHSLLIMRLATRVHAAFGVELPVRTVFLNPTLEAMANAIETRVCADILAMPETQAEQQLAEMEPKHARLK